MTAVPLDVLGVHPVDGRSDVHMLEVLVRQPAGSFDVSEFVQQDPTQPRSNWQSLWDEHYLSDDGEQVLPTRWPAAPGSTSEMTRLAFFMFFLAFDRPLLTPYGPVVLPAPTPMPDRLRRLIEFQEPD